MPSEKQWPAPGDRLVHKFRLRPGEVAAEVLSVDRRTGRVGVRVRSVDYASLSGAAQAVSGHPTNGWVYWGLKKQAPLG